MVVASNPICLENIVFRAYTAKLQYCIRLKIDYQIGGSEKIRFIKRVPINTLLLKIRFSWKIEIETLSLTAGFVIADETSRLQQ